MEELPRYKKYLQMSDDLIAQVAKHRADPEVLQPVELQAIETLALAHGIFAIASELARFNDNFEKCIWTDRIRVTS